MWSLVHLNGVRQLSYGEFASLLVLTVAPLTLFLLHTVTGRVQAIRSSSLMFGNASASHCCIADCRVHGLIPAGKQANLDFQHWNSVVRQICSIDFTYLIYWGSIITDSSCRDETKEFYLLKMNFSESLSHFDKDVVQKWYHDVSSVIVQAEGGFVRTQWTTPKSATVMSLPPQSYCDCMTINTTLYIADIFAITPAYKWPEHC